jgi:hypothetical protein
MREDQQHLQILSVLHYILGVLVGLFACLAIIYLVLGVAFVKGAFIPPNEPPPPPVLGWFFIGFASVALLIGWTMALAMFVAGYLLGRRQGYVFCMVVAGYECLFQPLGMVLGIFTFIVLMRPTVKKLFGLGPVVKSRPARESDPDYD